MRLTATCIYILVTLVVMVGSSQSAAETNHWRVSTYYAANLNDHGPGNRAMWCGDSTLAACGFRDSVGGVGHSMLDDLVWAQPVADAGEPVSVRLTAWVNYDVTDETWDFLELHIMRGDQEDLLASYTGSADNVFIDHTTVLQPGEYTGAAADEVTLKFRVWSDAAWDDEDCFSPSHGAAQLDDITVRFDGTVITFDDFEAGSPSSWQPAGDSVSGVVDTPRAGAISVHAVPNPFNPSTEVFFFGRSEARVTVTVFNVLGQKMETLFDGPATGDRQSVAWEPRKQASGVYLVRVASGGETAVEKVVLVE